MIVSKNLIAKFLPKIKTIDDQSFINACSAIGIEVENVINHPKTNNLVIGEILKVDNHPNADKLHVCEVKIDNNTINHIVCGAPNVVANKKVIVALTGAKLHDGRVIEYKELRGVLSQGMLCAYYELTPHHTFLSNDDEHGIMLLDDAVVGDTNIEKYIGLDDTMYELTLPSNRNDLNGILALCQELNLYFKWDFVWPKINLDKGIYKEDIALSFDESICNGIALIKIKNVSQTKSTWQFKSLLMNNGMKPLNNVLDKLSYVTLLTGVPTAVYDANYVGNSLEVVKSNKETVTGLDKKQYTLSNEDIVVKSNDKVLSIAGILGNNEYGLSPNTKDIVIEIANFNYVNIRNTTLKLNIQTDASKRFSKIIANYLVNLTANYVYEQFPNASASYLISKLLPQNEITIPMDFDYINKILGVKLQPNVIKDNLKYLGYTFENDTCIVPLYRLDVKTIQDISEEVTKFLNVNDLPTQCVVGPINTTQHNVEYELITKLKTLLNTNHFNEIKTYNLTKKENLHEFNVFKYTDFIRIENANNMEREYLRTNLIDAMLKVHQFNISYKTNLVPTFEMQKIYTKNKTDINLTLISPALIDIDMISKSKIIVNVNYLKAIANSIANLFNTSFEYIPPNESSVFYNNELLAIQCSGQLIGYIGCIKASCLKKYDLQNQNLYCLCMNLDMLFKMYTPFNKQLMSVSNLMPIYKDVSFTIHPLKKISNVIEALNQLDFIVSLEFIDRYVIDEETISYTIRFRFNNIKGLDTRTIDLYLKNIEKELIENHASVRK